MKYLPTIFITLFLLWASTDITAYDDTDDTANKERSGMRLFTDYGTGCQYLQAGLFGGMTPRWNHAGDHVGCHK